MMGRLKECTLQAVHFPYSRNVGGSVAATPAPPTLKRASGPSPFEDLVDVPIKRRVSRQVCMMNSQGTDPSSVHRIHHLSWTAALNKASGSRGEEVGAW